MSFRRDSKRCRNARKIIPLAFIKLPPTGFRPEPAPLLEKERYFGILALVPDGSRPIGMHRPRAGAAFAANNHPIDAGKVKSADRADQRLNGKKPHSGWYVPKMPDARYFRPVLDGDAKPHVDRATSGAVAPPEEVTHERRAFCEHLKCVPGSALHSLEDAIDEI